MIKRAYHQVVLLVAFLSCASSAVIFGRANFARVTAIEHQAPAVFPSRVSETESRQPMPPSIWSTSARTAEAGWRFDLFTPPAIFWDASIHGYQLSRSPKTERGISAGSTGIALQPFDERAEVVAPRLQLLGYVQRAAGEVAGIFQNLQTSEVRVVLSGSPVDEWRVTVESVELESARITNDTSDVQIPQARALIRDELLGCTYPLSTLEVPSPSANLAGKTDLLVRKDFSRDG